MEEFTHKKALVILTNEAYIPKTSRGGRRPFSTPTDGCCVAREDGPAGTYSPSAWVPNQPTILDPPTAWSTIANTEPTFLTGHQPTGVDVCDRGYIGMTLRKQ